MVFLFWLCRLSPAAARGCSSGGAQSGVLFFFCRAVSLLLHRPFSSFRLLSAVASPAVEQALQRLWPMGSVAAAPRLYSTGSAVVEHSLSCSAAYAIFLEEGLNLCPLPWWADSYPLHHQGSPKKFFF